MSDRITVLIRETTDGREPDYDGGFDDAVYFDDNRPEAVDLEDGEVSIVPH